MDWPPVVVTGATDTLSPRNAHCTHEPPGMQAASLMHSGTKEQAVAAVRGCESSELPGLQPAGSSQH